MKVAIHSSTSQLPHLVVIGNGLAGMRTVEELLQIAPNQFSITVIGKENQLTYNRIMLSPVLAGEKVFEDIIVNQREWYDDHQITLKLGVTVIDSNLEQQHILLNSGEVIHYDYLLMATGSNPFLPPLENHLHPDVFTFRNYHDVKQMLRRANSIKKAVVVGGGLLGLEAANGLLQQGLEVTVVHDKDYLLNRQLDFEAAKLLQDYLENNGVRFYLEGLTDRIVVNSLGELKGLEFKCGDILESQMIVMAIGVRPNVKLAKQVGLNVDKGIVVNDYLQTSHPNVYAVGECVEHQQNTFGLVAPIFAQAKIAAHHLAGAETNPFVQKATATTLKVTGINLYSAGDFSGIDAECLVYRDKQAGTYKKLFIKNNQLVGAVLYGDIQDGPYYFALIQDNTDISDMRHRLMFGAAI